MRRIAVVCFIFAFCAMLKADHIDRGMEYKIKNSQLVFVGQPVNMMEYNVLINTHHRIATFKLNDLYKSCHPIEIPYFERGVAKEPNGFYARGKFVNIVYVSQLGNSCWNPPDYKLGKKYIVFLSTMVEYGLFTRTDYQDGECELDPNTETDFRIAMQRLEEIKKGSAGDYVTYRIPSNAEVKTIKETDPNSGYAYFNEYWLNGEQVGRRGYYKNNQLAYEWPMKRGKSYGVAREWYEDGRKSRVETLLDDVNHGIVRTWDENGKKRELYCIYLEPVDKERYMAEAKNDPRLKAALRIK